MPRRGQLSVRDLRAVYGDALCSMSDVSVLVLAEDDSMPVAARVELGQRRWGWSWRPALVCPTCGGVRDSLFARAGRLQCSDCHGEHTRQQLEKRRADWVRRGAREEDRLLRLLRPSSGDAKLHAARRLVQDILCADEARLEEVQQQLGDVTVCMSMSR